MPWTTETPFQALALTGGGFRGLFAAKALEAIEAHIGEPIARKFDLICGTSIGGVIAIAAAFEIPMKKVVGVFEERGTAIFPPHSPPETALGKVFDLYRYSRKARYSVEPLREAIEQLVARDALLGDAKHPLAIPAVNVTQGRPQVFKTRHKPEWNRDWKLKAVDVALATSAAPTFFALADVEGALYADGGLFANAPDLVALHEAEHFFGVATDAVRLLSIGTTTRSYSISFDAGRNFGIADWMDEQRLFSVIISTQQQFVAQLIEHKLGSRYLRLDHEPSQEQARDLGLDNASDAAKKTLLALGSKVATDLLGTRLVPFLSHVPQLKVLRG
jgi:uncharacterized protein